LFRHRKWHNGSDAYARSFTHGAEIFFGGMDDHWNVPACDYDPTGLYDERLPRTVDFHTQQVQHKIADHVRASCSPMPPSIFSITGMRRMRRSSPPALSWCPMTRARCQTSI